MPEGMLFKVSGRILLIRMLIIIRRRRMLILVLRQWAAGFR